MDLRVLFAVAAVAAIGMTGAAFAVEALTLRAYSDAFLILATIGAILYGLASDAPEPKL